MEFHELEKDPWCDEANPRKVDFEQARKDNFPQFFLKKLTLSFFHRSAPPRTGYGTASSGLLATYIKNI